MSRRALARRVWEQPARQHWQEASVPLVRRPGFPQAWRPVTVRLALASRLVLRWWALWPLAPYQVARRRPASLSLAAQVVQRLKVWPPQQHSNRWRGKPPQVA
jgi:hypothetical protein